MDAYVREFGCSGEHSEFYTNRTIIEHFKTYIRSIVSRYKDSKALFAWEIANDPRCASSLPASDDCNTLTVTDWVDEIAKEVKCVDENHIVSSGCVIVVYSETFFDTLTHPLIVHMAFSVPTAPNDSLLHHLYLRLHLTHIVKNEQ